MDTKSLPVWALLGHAAVALRRDDHVLLTVVARITESIYTPQYH